MTKSDFKCAVGCMPYNWETAQHRNCAIQQYILTYSVGPSSSIYCYFCLKSREWCSGELQLPPAKWLCLFHYIELIFADFVMQTLFRSTNDTISPDLCLCMKMSHNWLSGEKVLSGEMVFLKWNTSTNLRVCYLISSPADSLYYP